MMKTRETLDDQLLAARIDEEVGLSFSGSGLCQLCLECSKSVEAQHSKPTDEYGIGNE